METVPFGNSSSGDRSPGDLRRAGREDIAALASFIRENFVEDLHIEDFVKETHLSKHHLIRLFEKQTGVTPYRYLNLCRVRHAEKLLRHTDIPVGAIACGVGFNSATVFIRQFRAFCGMTPREYRRRHGAEAEKKP